MTHRDIQAVYEELRTTRGNAVDAVVFSCPHCGYSSIHRIAWLLEGQWVNSGVRLWVSTSRRTRLMAQQTGLVKVIERAGGLGIADTYVAPGVPYDLIEGIRTVAIDSARGGYFISGACEVKVIFGTTEKCVRAAITGRWR